MQQTSGDNLNKGWFLVYKVALIFHVISFIYYSGKCLITGEGLSQSFATFLVNVFQPLILAAILSLQFIAMHKRDLKKAKIGLLLLSAFTGLLVGLWIYVASSYLPWDTKFPALFLGLLSIALLSVLTYGSFQVYKTLKPNGTSSGDLFKGILNV